MLEQNLLLGATWVISEPQCVPMVAQSKKNSDFEVVLGSHLAPKIKKKPLCFKLFFDMVSAAAFHGP